MQHEKPTLSLVSFLDILRKAMTKSHRSGLRMHGAMDAILVRADGSKDFRHKDNLIVDVGFDFIADAIGKASGRPGVMSHIAVGTDNTAAAGAQTTLVTELARKAATYAHTAGTKVFTFETTFDPGEATGAIVEAGVLNASSAGILLDRVVFAVINKGNDDTLTQRFTFTMA